VKPTQVGKKETKGGKKRMEEGEENTRTYYLIF
jgi:hypothetical protein